MADVPARAPRKPRPAARLFVLDSDDRLLLFRFTADDRPPFWCTAGGALDPGESYAQAAARELFEETGLALDPGPEVAQRHVKFLTLEGERVEADERYFLIRTPTTEIATHGHTALEQRVMQRWHWFTRDELGNWPETIYPEDIVAMLDTVTAPA